MATYRRFLLFVTSGDGGRSTPASSRLAPLCERLMRAVIRHSTDTREKMFAIMFRRAIVSDFVGLTSPSQE